MPSPGSGWLFDTVVLSNFTLIGELELLRRRYAVSGLVTTEVLDEVAKGIAAGYALTPVLDLVDTDFDVITLDGEERRVFQELLRFLGAGEASCVAVASRRGGVVVTDDRAARNACQDLTIHFTGTVGIFKASCRDRLLTLVDADAMLERMREVGFYSPVKRISDII